MVSAHRPAQVWFPRGLHGGAEHGSSGAGAAHQAAVGASVSPRLRSGSHGRHRQPSPGARALVPTVHQGATACRTLPGQLFQVVTS